MAPSGDVGWGRVPKAVAQPKSVAKPKALTQLEILKQIKDLKKRKEDEEAATELYFRLEVHDAGRQREKEEEDEEATRKLMEDLLSEQEGASVATSTRSRTTNSRSVARPETLQEMQERMLGMIAEAKRIDQQNAELQAINDATALTDTTLLNDDNPLYCIVCMEIIAEESHMRGWTCHIRRHFICRDCWIKVEFCPSCGKSAKRFLPGAPHY